MPYTPTKEEQETMQTQQQASFGVMKPTVSSAAITSSLEATGNSTLPKSSTPPSQPVQMVGEQFKEVKRPEVFDPTKIVTREKALEAAAKMKADGIDPDDGFQQLEERGYIIEGWAEAKRKAAKHNIENALRKENEGAWLHESYYEREKQKEEEDKSLYDKINDPIEKHVKDLVGGFVFKVPEMIGEAGKAGANLLDSTLGSVMRATARSLGVDEESEAFKGLMGSIPDEDQKLERVLGMGQTKEEIMDSNGIDQDAFLTKAGEFMSELTTTMLLTKNVGPAIQNMGVFKNMPFMGKIIGGGVDGVADVAAYNVISEGELPDVKEMGAGGLIGASIPVAGKGMSLVWNGVKDGAKGLANKLQLSGLLNPKKLEYVANALKETGDDVDNVANWMFDRNVQGSKTQIVKQLENLAQSTKSQVDEAIGKADGLFQPTPVRGALEELVDAIGSPKSSAGIEKLDEVTSMIEKIDNGGLDLTEIQQVKRWMDDTLRVHTIAGDVRAGQHTADLASLRQEIRKFIEDVAGDQNLGDVKLLNRDTAVAMQLNKYINYKDKTDAVREMLSPFASPFAGGVLGAITGGDTLEEKMIRILAFSGIGKAAGSTWAKTNAANIINKLSPSDMNMLGNHISGIGETAISVSLYEKIAELLEEPSDSSKN